MLKYETNRKSIFRKYDDKHISSTDFKNNSTYLKKLCLCCMIYLIFR